MDIDIQIVRYAQRDMDRDIWTQINIQIQKESQVDTDRDRDIWRVRFEERDMKR